MYWQCVKITDALQHKHYLKNDQGFDNHHKGLQIDTNTRIEDTRAPARPACPLDNAGQQRAGFVCIDPACIDLKVLTSVVDGAESDTG